MAFVLGVLEGYMEGVRRGFQESGDGVTVEDDGGSGRGSAFGAKGRRPNCGGRMHYCDLSTNRLKREELPEGSNEISWDSLKGTNVSTNFICFKGFSETIHCRYMGVLFSFYKRGILELDFIKQTKIS